MTEEDRVAYCKIPRMNLVDLWSTANAWHVARENAAIEAELLAIRTAPVRLIECRTVRLYGDGWRWVHVSGEAALRAEGDAMAHCVGNGSYSRLTGISAILSLRDPEGMPHVTVQMNGEKMISMQGRSNSAPVRYLHRIGELVERCGALLQTHETVGWASDELAETVEAARVAREAAEAAREAAEADAREAKRLADLTAIAERQALDARIALALSDEATLTRVLEAAAAGETHLTDMGVLTGVVPDVLLEMYAGILERQREVALFQSQMDRAKARLEAAMDEQPQPIRYIATMDVQHAIQGPNTPVDIVTWAVSNGLLGDRGGQGLRPYQAAMVDMLAASEQAAERETFEVRPWRTTSVRFDPVPGDREAMIRTPSGHGAYAGQGRIGSIRPGMSADDAGGIQYP